MAGGFRLGRSTVKPRASARTRETYKGRSCTISSNSRLAELRTLVSTLLLAELCPLLLAELRTLVSTLLFAAEEDGRLVGGCSRRRRGGGGVVPGCRISSNSRQLVAPKGVLAPQRPSCLRSRTCCDYAAARRRPRTRSSPTAAPSSRAAAPSLPRRRQRGPPPQRARRRPPRRLRRRRCLSRA